ncbi:unnamed protein product [Rotaria sp. Silwood1]|nr:unnamed protein product [Rotaria sp. Silwood1]
MQLRTQLSDLKNIRKDLENLHADNSTLQAKYKSINTQRNRDKQRIADLEKNTLLKYRESQIDTEVLYQHLTQLQKRNGHLQDSLSAETRIKLDQFSAFGEVKRQLTIANKSQIDTEVLYQHLTQLQKRNGHLQDSLSAETRIKLDQFSAFGEVKRQLTIANSLCYSRKERELIAALHSQHQVNNCLFNDHPQTSGHSSSTNQLIDTNNLTTSSSSVFYSPPTAITPLPLPLQNATFNLDPNAQNFCLSKHSTNNN